MSKFLSASLLALGVTLAAPSVAQQTVLGTLLDTSDSGAWKFKYLGEPNPGEVFDWASQRTYIGGVLDATGYAQAETPLFAWPESTAPWISSSPSGYDKNGYYSYVATINDNLSGTLGVGEVLSFTSLSVSYIADDYVRAIVINGTLYEGAIPQNSRADWVTFDSAVLSGIPWNINGPNMIEIIVQNDWANYDNPTGFTGMIRATYQISAVPEPETCAMMLAGLALVGVVARRRRKSL
ncbi:MAG: PEP-CTERM sorting domain-containing protein [Azoarcus sp.]|jgi:hypothetical protein|nr:PEP-CTERM sorting domain-containing protein [Azoarcus sp.]